MKSLAAWALAAGLALSAWRAAAQPAAGPRGERDTPAQADPAAHETPAAESGDDTPASPTLERDAVDVRLAAPVVAASPSEEAERADVPDPDDLLSASELAELGIQLDAPAVDTSLRISGFGDFTTVIPLAVDSVAASGVNAGGTKYTSFAVGNANLYVSKNLSEAFRAMLEVRFTFLPNGSLDVSNLQQNEFNYAFTQVADYADGGHLEKWGGIIMQRFYLEWNLHPLVTVRAGQFLTPYGIWNVDHGSPTYIPVTRPYAIGNNWFPQRQTGFEVFGRVDAASAWSVGYHLTLSNGAGPFSEYKDLDANKAIGGRLFLEHHGAGHLRVGASGYYGRDTASVPSISVDPEGNLVGRENIQSQYDSLALAADLQYKLRGLWLQAEWVSQQRRYTADGRPTAVSFVGQGWAMDTFSWAGYLLVGYRLPWWALMPYVMLQYDDEITVLGAVDARLWVLHAGLNLHPIDSVTFKLEYLRAQEVHDVISPYNTLQLQAAWAF